MTKAHSSVWDALENSPEEAENMKLRSTFMMAITEYANKSGETQTVVAERLGITQPRLNDLLKGKITKFSLDKLVEIAVRAGMSINLDIKAA